jgi:hypothetical protein
MTSTVSPSLSFVFNISTTLPRMLASVCRAFTSPRTAAARTASVCFRSESRLMSSWIFVATMGFSLPFKSHAAAIGSALAASALSFDPSKAVSASSKLSGFDTAPAIAGTCAPAASSTVVMSGAMLGAAFGVARMKRTKAIES